MDSKRAREIAFGFFLLLITSQTVLATTDYVLPYPGLMPGNRLYTFKQTFDRFYRLWFWGNFARHRYELGLADKKLVEAKVLFEYQQYLLGHLALQESNDHFQKAKLYLEAAKEEGKNISQKMANLKAAAKKHQKILGEIQEKLPEQFLWQPERGEATELNLKTTIGEAMKIREI